MRYIINGVGWWVDRDKRVNVDTPRFFAPGTVIDDSKPQWAGLAGIGPPMDAVPLDIGTYNYMISNGVAGLGYPYWAVKMPPGGLFTMGQSTLGGGDVLG